MTSVSELLQDKASDLWTVAPDDTVYDALQLMADKNIGAVLVLDSDQIVGLFSERDYARKLALKQRSSRETRVRDVMTERIAYVEPSEDIESCLALMTDKHFRHLPVMENSELVGLVSIGDLVKGVLADKEFIIAQLEHYISGSP